MEEYKALPGVDTILNLRETKELIQDFGFELVSYSVKISIQFYREAIKNGEKAPKDEQILHKVKKIIDSIAKRNLKPVINATGIIVHTNLGRAPFGEKALQESFDVLKGYNNLEYDLQKAKRGHRNDHGAKLLKYLTGAEDVLVVNNNAAAVMLMLRTFARHREVIVSRGELIEIGGSFRIPEIMAASECKMVEVGSTNKTKIEDYENAITDNTALLFKAHKSNYVIKGFTKEASLEELVRIGKKYKIPVIYDVGSGLLRKVNEQALKDEPDVKTALASGIDLISFSGDKLIGGPQAGIIAGKKEYIAKLKKEPMMRALRVSKTTLTFLETAFSYYLNDDLLFNNNMIFKTLNKNLEEIETVSIQLQKYLSIAGIESEVIESKGQYGGGSAPDHNIDSFSVRLIFKGTNKEQSRKAENVFYQLLDQDSPVLGILTKGQLHFNMLTIQENEIPVIAGVLSKLILEKE